MTKSYQTIWLHQLSPSKPSEGEPCNGCGVCCAITPCPVARIRFLRFWRPLKAADMCPALVWSAAETRYQCGLISQSHAFWRKLPSALRPFWQRMLLRWIAAGIGCDSSASIETDKTP